MANRERPRASAGRGGERAPAEAPSGSLQRAAVWTAGALGLRTHAEALGLPGYAAAVDRLFASGEGSYPEGAGFRLLVDGALAVVAGAAAETVVLGLHLLFRPEPLRLSGFRLNPLMLPYAVLPAVGVVGLWAWRRSAGVDVPRTARPGQDGAVALALSAGLVVIGFRVQFVSGSGFVVLPGPASPSDLPYLVGLTVAAAGAVVAAATMLWLHLAVVQPVVL